MTTVGELHECRVLGLLNNIEVFGQERANIEVFKSLRRQGAEVTVGVNCLNAGGELRAYVEREGFQTFRLPFGCQWSKRFFWKDPSLIITNVARIIECSKVLRHEAKKRGASHIHIGNSLVYSFVALYLSRNKRVKVIYRAGDASPMDSLPNYLIWKQFCRRANQIVANSQFVRSTIVDNIPWTKQVSLIYNVAPSYTTTSNGADTTSRVSEQGSHILYVGQISEHKGICLFIDFAISFASSRSDVVVDIVGGSMYTKPLQQELMTKVEKAGLSNRVRMHGHIEDPTPFYRLAKVLVVPTITEEPAANVVLEAKCQGVPAIVFPSGGLPELITEGRTGWICREKTPNGIRQIVEQYLSDECAQKQCSEWCRAEYKEKFSAERFDRAWARVYLS